jgi:hypothetical protein
MRARRARDVLRQRRATDRVVAAAHSHSGLSVTTHRVGETSGIKSAFFGTAGAHRAFWILAPVPGSHRPRRGRCVRLDLAVQQTSRASDRRLRDAVSRRGELGSICGYQRPEDLELIPSQNIVLASEARTGGRLMGLRVDDLGAGPFQLWPTLDDAVVKTQRAYVGSRQIPLHRDDGRRQDRRLPEILIRPPTDESKPRVISSGHNRR